MLPPKESRKVLVKMFRTKYIANLDELFDVLDTHSRMSVFRRLKPLGYLSSFTDAGSFYTLQDIPKFDTLGLWFYQDVGFSRAGTLKSTVIDIVHFSEAGKTPMELLNLLHLKVANSLHNSLHGLVKGKHLKRYRLQGLALYTSIDSDIANKQIAARGEKIKSGLQVPTVVSIEVTIAALVEALRAGKILVPPSTVAARLNAQGMTIGVDQVEQIFSQYGLEAEKKRESNLEDAIGAQRASAYTAQPLYKESFRSERSRRNGKGTARLLRDLPEAHARTKEFSARGTKHRAWNIRCE